MVGNDQWYPFIRFGSVILWCVLMISVCIRLYSGNRYPLTVMKNGATLGCKTVYIGIIGCRIRSIRLPSTMSRFMPLKRSSCVYS